MAKKKRGHNEGSIRQRKDGAWEARYTTGRTADGKLIRKSIYGKTRKEVSEKLTYMLQQVNAGTYIDPSSMPFDEWLKIWLEEYKKGSVKPSTYIRYRVCVETHINKPLGEIKLKDLRTDTVQKLINEKSRSGLSARSCEYIYVTIHAALDQAVKNNLLLKNVSNGVNTPKQTRKEIEVLTVEDQDKLLKVANEHEYGIAIYIGMMTGMRLGEVLALKWDDIKDNTIRVCRNIQRLREDRSEKSKLVIQESTKSNNRTIPILSKLKTKLDEHKAKQVPHLKKKWIICDKNHDPMEPRRIERYVQDMAKDAGVKVHFHVLRHTFATRGLEKGIHVKVMSGYLGHSSVAMTMDIYSHVLESTQKTEILKLENVF